jgi:hypothetical protein
MRINVYAEEMPAIPDVRIVEKDGHRGLRIFLESSPLLHNTATDDDRSAITFWNLHVTADLVSEMVKVMAEARHPSEAL